MTRLRFFLTLSIAVSCFILVAACASDDNQQPSSAAGQQTKQATQAQQTAQSQPQALADQADADASVEPLRIGLMLDFSGGLAEYGTAMRRGFDLAIQQINAAGGVWGRPVEAFVADSTLDPTVALEEARRLIEVEGIHVFVCCTASAITLAVIDLAAPAGIPVVTPSATSPQITIAEDDDFLFRATLSDATQGSVMVKLAADRGFDNVAMLYRNDAWGQGYAESVENAWQGELVSIATEPTQTTFVAELQQSTAQGAKVLLVALFVPEAKLAIREALELGIYEQFLFSNATQSLQVIEAIGAEYLAGMYGTGPASAPEGTSVAAWEAAYLETYGEPPDISYVKETYDATVALALAAQAAGTTAGGAIRDQLRAIGSGPGTEIIASQESLAEALSILADGGDVDYTGAATAMDWDQHGDLATGYSSIWRYTADGNFEVVEIVTYAAP